MNNMNHDLPSPSRIVWLDIVRLTAMLMVIGVHCIDPFYISPTLGTLPEYKFWASVYGSLFRPSVPLFAMMTGLLLLPVGQQPLGVFYKKRIFRVLFPFLIWSVLYNLFPWFTGVVGLPKSIIGDFLCYVQRSESQRVSKKYLAPSIYSYPYWRLKSNIRFYKGVFCLFGHPHRHDSFQFLL